MLDEEQCPVGVLDDLGDVSLGGTVRASASTRCARWPGRGSPSVRRALRFGRASITWFEAVFAERGADASSSSTVRSSWWSGKSSRARSVSAHTLAGRPRPSAAASCGDEAVRRERVEVLAHARPR